jgi:NhaP-type Na+/H+ or K+/H+ antiporter
MSLIMGGVVAICSALFLKKLKFIKLNRVQEVTLIVLFSFISYTLSEEIGLSPIIALLFTGIFMQHYTFYNLSFQSREESTVIIKMISNIAEAFVFTYLGLIFIYYMTKTVSFSFIFIEFFIVLFGRIVGVFGISFLME